MSTSRASDAVLCWPSGSSSSTLFQRRRKPPWQRLNGKMFCFIIINNFYIYNFIKVRSCQVVHFMYILAFKIVFISLLEIWTAHVARPNLENVSTSWLRRMRTIWANHITFILASQYPVMTFLYRSVVNFTWKYLSVVNFTWKY